VVDNESQIAQDKPAKLFENIYSGKKYEFDSYSTILLLDRLETNGFELLIVNQTSHNKSAMVSDPEKEQTFFVIKGTGAVTIADETETVKPGDVVFVPRNIPYTTESFENELVYLCLNSNVIQPKDASFEAMYKRISQQRLER